jgi:tRNA(Ile)-lysidine synthase
MASQMATSDNFPAMFAATMTRLTGEDMAALQAPKVGLAVSGGPDSLAMMLLAHAAFPKAIRIATVDHGLRPEAAEEAAYVAGLCTERGLAHDILKPAIPITGNLQSSARKARYGLLHGWADRHELQWIATAHHADDQLETLLMRIARGSGLAGLSAIRERNGAIIRPLLGFTKAQLIEICAQHSVVPCEDPSNANLDFDRVQFRNWLKQAPASLDARRVSRTVSALRETHQALEWVANGLEKDRISGDATRGVVLDPAGLPAELVRRLLIRALQQVDPEISPRGETTDRALACLYDGGKLTVGNVLCIGGAIWHLEIAPPRATIG